MDENVIRGGEPFVAEPLVKIRNVTKRIRKKTIINNLTVDIYPGEVFGFLGPNGAGKTTTIRMLVGLMSITSGEIYIKGINLKRNFEEAVSHVGGIVENPEMYKFLTGYQNLLHYSRMVKGVTKERIDEVVQLVGLENRIRDKVKSYSLGMRQRLGLAQALLHSPSLLILDEPTNGLDPAGIREFRDHIRKIAKEGGIAVFVSSHILAEMEQMCDRIGIIQQGKLIDVQTVNAFVQREENQRQSVILTVDNFEKAKTEIQELIHDINISQIDQDKLELQLAWDQIPEVNVKLVQSGIKVYRIQPVTKTLEDKFLEMTGGNEIV